MDVQSGFCEHLVTSSWGAFVTSKTNKLKLQDSFITPSRIPVRDEQSGPIFTCRNLT
jgi:hypothetical protein